MNRDSVTTGNGPYERLLTPGQVADALNVSVKTIYHWTHRAEIPFVKVGKHLRFELSKVLKSFAERTEVENHQTSCLSVGPLLESATSKLVFDNQGVNHLRTQERVRKWQL